jgi:hypothetical protein
MAVATQKPKLSVYLDQETLDWFQGYCKTQERSISAQIVFMIKRLRQEVEENDRLSKP